MRPVINEAGWHYTMRCGSPPTAGIRTLSKSPPLPPPVIFWDSHWTFSLRDGLGDARDSREMRTSHSDQASANYFRAEVNGGWVGR